MDLSPLLPGDISTGWFPRSVVGSRQIQWRATIGAAMGSRRTWIVQVVILLITAFVFRSVLEASNAGVAIVAGALTFLVPTIVWARLERKDPD